MAHVCEPGVRQLVLVESPVQQPWQLLRIDFGAMADLCTIILCYNESKRRNIYMARRQNGALGPLAGLLHAVVASDACNSGHTWADVHFY